MKPCCFPTDERCVDIAAEWDYAYCEENGGVLGPEGACCHDPAEGTCIAPDQKCWRCSWEVPNHADRIRRCCFANLDYQWFPDLFSLEQCEFCGGDVGVSQEACAPPQPVLTRPCCVPFQECHDIPVSYAEEWCNSNGGVLGPPGACCQNPSPEGPDVTCFGDKCWKCDWPGAVAGSLDGSCCFDNLNFHWEPNIPFDQCYLCGGVIGEPFVGEDECQPPEPEPECIDAPREDRPNPAIVDNEGTQLKWTLDTIGTIVLGMSAMDECQLPDPPPKCRGILRGYQYPLSTHLIRPKQADEPRESCGHAGGRMAMLDDGYVYVETCSQPDRTSGDSFRRSYGLMRTFLPDENTPLAQANRALGMQDGYQYSVGCIRLPWWTEATYRSYAAKCGSDIS